MKHFVISFCFVISSLFLPLIAFADFDIPAGPPIDEPALEVSFIFNDELSSVEISTSTPTVNMEISFTEEVYLTRLYICSESVECDQGSATKYFSPNATTSAYSAEWDGVGAPADTYEVTARFYYYESQEEVYEETAEYVITVLEEEEAEVVPSPIEVDFLIERDEISSTTASVTLTASSSESIYFSALYVCLEDDVPCDETSYAQKFDVSATSTEVFEAWDGSGVSGDRVAEGVYKAVLNYFNYASSIEVVSVTASTTISVLEEVSGEPEPVAVPEPEYVLVNRETYPSNTNIGTKTWTKEAGPYVVQGEVYIRYGALTIEPGTVVKFDEDAVFTVHASVPLTISGTQEEPVIFTSLKDDSVGGDTNGDGDASAPAPGDWGYAGFGSGGVNKDLYLRYLKVWYGGGVSLPEAVGSFAPALYLWYPSYSGATGGSSGSIDYLEVTQSADVGVAFSIGPRSSVSISESSFHDNARYGTYVPFFLSHYGYPIDSNSPNLSGNWWGDTSGPYHEVLNPEGVGEVVGVASGAPSPTLDSWLESDPFEAEPERYDCCSSVLFLPGLQGSVLKSGNNILWPPTIGDVDGDLGKLAFEDGVPVTDDVVTNGIVNSSYLVEVYQGFTDFMNLKTVVDSETGTSTIKEWKPFAYDWRYLPDEIVENGTETSSGHEDFITTLEALADSSYTGQVTLVAHSYGGLVGKALIKKLQGEGKEDLVNSFIMVGSPQLGTPQAIAGLLHGEGSDLGVNISGHRIVTLVSENNAKNLGLTLDSAHVLLPSPTYFERVPDPVVVFNPGFSGSLLSKWYSSYDHGGISSHDDLFEFLQADRVPRTTNPSKLESSLLVSAQNWHSEYDDFSFPHGMRVVQIAGWGLSTIKGVEYSSGEKDFYKVLLTTEGDRTVVYPSAIADSNAETYFLNLDIYNIDPEQEDYTHLDLLSFPSAQSLLQDIFTNSPIQTSIFVTESKPEEDSENNLLVVSAHSPVTLGVTDQFGNYTGITPGQDPDADILTITTDIPGSSYFTVGDAKYITLPNDGWYSFVMGGTGEGEVTVFIETLSQGDNQAIVATYNFTVSDSSEATLSVVDGSPEAIELDQDGDGSVDETVLSEEVQAEQSATDQESANETETTPPSGGGGGVVWNTPTTTEETVEEFILPTSTQPTTVTSLLSSVPEESVEELEIPVVESGVSQQQIEIQNTKVDASPTAPTSTPTASVQTASVIQSGWYDEFMSAIKDFFNKSVGFFKSLF